MEQLGCTGDVVANGLEVLEALQRVPYDIVLLDCLMPEMDGYEATVKIRECERRRAPGFDRKQPVRIIAMTAKAMQGDSEKCLAAGMDDYVSKPVQIADLRRALQQWQPADDDASDTSVDANESPGSGPARVGSASPLAVPNGNVGDTPPKPPVDLERLNEVTAGNPEKARRIIGTYLKQADEIIRSLDQAIQGGAANDVRNLAHKLGGASSACGMVAVLPPLAQLERLGEAGRLNGATEAYAEASQQLERVRQFLNSQLGNLQAARRF